MRGKDEHAQLRGGAACGRLTRALRRTGETHSAYTQGGAIRSRIARYGLLMGVLLMAAICDRSALAERAGGGMITRAESVESVEIIVNKSKTFTLARPFSTVTVGSGDIAEA